MLTGDENIIDVQFVVFWLIKDAADFLFNVRNPELTVKAVAESAMREVIGKSKFEFARTVGRAKITGETQALIQQILDEYKTGILVRGIEIQGVEPPEAVIDAFKDVAAAKQDAKRAENEATAYKNEVTQRDRSSSPSRGGSGSCKEEQIAQAVVKRNLPLGLPRVRAGQNVTRRRLYLETMEQVLEGMDKVLVEEGKGGGSGVVPPAQRASQQTAGI